MSSSGTTLIVAVTIVLIIVIVAATVIAAGASSGKPWAHLNYWKSHYAESPDRIYERSAGGFDEAAALALKRSEDQPVPTFADHFRAANIIHRNVVAQQHRPTAFGTAEANEEISRLREMMFWRARDHYAAALGTLTNATIAQEEADRAIRRFNLPVVGGAVFEENMHAPPRGERPGRPTAGNVIDLAREFAYNAVLTFVENAAENWVVYGHHAPAFGENRLDGAGQEMMFLIDENLAAMASNRQEAAIQTRRAAAAEVSEANGRSGGPVARAVAFLDLSQQQTSDSQNSHDPSVNAAKKEIVARLRAEQGPVDRLPGLDAILAEITSSGESAPPGAGKDAFTRDPHSGRPRPALAEKAAAVVDRARRGERSLAAAATDEEVLRRVWARADDPRNLTRHDSMRQAAFDALVDCWDQGIGGEEIQCVDGRIGRLLGSLAWLDWDEKNWDIRRLEQYKNDIFARAAQVIHESAVEAARSADPGLQKVGRAYLATSKAELDQVGEVEEAKEREWTEAARAKVGREIDALVAALGAAVPGYAAEGIKMEAMAAL